MKSGKCKLCGDIIFEKNNCVEVGNNTYCPRCFTEVRNFFIKEQLDMEALKEKIKKELCDNCDYNPFHDKEQIWYR